MTDFLRTQGRALNALRSVQIQRHFTMHAEGAVLITFGNTQVLCTASVEEKVPGHKKGSGEGWVTMTLALPSGAARTFSVSHVSTTVTS